MVPSSPAVRCPRCDKALPWGTAFCRRCGEKQRLPAARAYVPHAPADAPPRPERGASVPGFWVAAGVLLAVLVTALLWLASSSRPARVAAPARISAPPAVRSFQPPAMVVSPLPPDPVPARPDLPDLPPLPEWQRHLPADLPPVRADGRPDYRGQLLTQHQFPSLRLSDVVFAGAGVSQCDFGKADLAGADFRGADLSQVDFGGADLAGAKFDEARLQQTTFVGVDAAAVDGQTRVRNGITEAVPPRRLPAEHLGRASFRGARLSQISLDDMVLSGADFSGAEFSSVGFRNADLSNANLRDTRHHMTDFEGARLEGADLRGADLTSAQNLTSGQLNTAHVDSTTRLPRW